MLKALETKPCDLCGLACKIMSFSFCIATISRYKSAYHWMLPLLHIIHPHMYECTYIGNYWKTCRNRAQIRKTLDRCFYSG